jgi:hypothetical protein
MSENIYVEKDEKLIVGFINSYGELEYTEYEAKDGGVFKLDDSKEYTKEELEDFLLENV